jgi:outer membrane lipoprotein-sorting protein
LAIPSSSSSETAAGAAGAEARGTNLGPEEVKVKVSLQRRLALISLAGTLLAAQAIPLASAPDPKKPKTSRDMAEILSRMDESAKRLKTLAADIEYTKMTVLVNDKSSESGRLFFRNGKNPEILIQIQKPDAKFILFKKNKAEIFNPKTNQLQEYDLEEHSGLVQQFFLLGFGTETGELKKSYMITYITEEELSGDTTVVLDLLPRKEAIAAQLAKVRLWISEESWLPVQQQFFEPNDDYLLAHYTNVKVNRQLPSRAFEIPGAKDAKRVKMH